MKNTKVKNTSQSLSIGSLDENIKHQFYMFILISNFINNSYEMLLNIEV